MLVADVISERMQHHSGKSLGVLLEFSMKLASTLPHIIEL